MISFRHASCYIQVCTCCVIDISCWFCRQITGHAGSHRTYKTFIAYYQLFFRRFCSGPAWAIELVCVSVCLCIRFVTFTLNTADLDILYSGSHWPYMDQFWRSRLRDEKYSCLAMDARPDVTRFWLFVELFVVKRSVRPRVRALTM